MNYMEAVKAIMEDDPRAADLIRELIVEKLREDPEIQAVIKAEPENEFSAEISVGPIAAMIREEFAK